ncbi:uncharacterized protein N7473_012823 [Penicillium subrubescens]|uniref:uncharacterized protein n=1 Tax=Penicillium subrubescens TaxID=1316194 RepID=UPI002545A4FA|nr:uncharacterized protein N7473_012823 [Penicillium subrubescens]KAJ5875476.1 hypothetical protein N7473_012823 [Penicillium subrubescens]
MLLQLPTETLCLISAQLENQHNRLHLASSCRRLYTALHRTIFVEVKLCAYRPGVPVPEIRQVSQFLYTIVRNPDLASVVQVLDLCSWQTKTTCDNHGYPSDIDFDRDIMERLVREASSDSKRQVTWIKDLECGITDAWLALMIPRLNNLRKISFIWSIQADYVYGMLIDAAKAETPVFPHLEEAWAAPRDTEGWSETELMLPFFNFPAMRKLGGHMLYDGWEWTEEENQRNPWGLPVEIGCSNVTDIDLRMSCANDGLQTWIRSCKALKTFRYSHGGATVAYEPSNHRRLYEALLLHKTTLQAVSISEDEYGIDPEENENFFLGSFADFTNLKTLHAPCTGIVEQEEGRPTQSLVDILPPSLELLSLFYHDMELLVWLLEECELLLDSNVCPKLGTICIRHCGLNETEIAHKVENLKLRCEDAGVSLRNFHSDSRDEMEYWDSVWPFDHDFDQ